MASNRPGSYFNFNEQIQKVCIRVPFRPVPLVSSSSPRPSLLHRSPFPLKAGTKFQSEIRSPEIVLHSIKRGA